MQRWFLDFYPLSALAMITLVWLRILNLSLHLWSSDSLTSIGNSLGKFIKNHLERISKGLATFSHIYIELDLSKGFPDKIYIEWGGPKPQLHLIDYEHTTFRCRSYQQPRHLQAACPTALLPSGKRWSRGW